jgi:serine/threonine protein kinase
MTHLDPSAAVVVLRRYRAGELLARRRSTEIWAGTDLETGEGVAIKILRRSASDEPDVGARLEREVRTTEAVRHRHVVRLLAHGEHEGRPCLVLERLIGATLEERLASGPLSADATRRLAHELIDALEAVHRVGLVHRDVKPANVWLREPSGRSVLFDLGMSRATARDTITRDHEGVAGSPAYLAPERWKGHAATPRSDLFSLGALLYEARTGRRAFEAPNPFVLRSRILSGDWSRDIPADLAPWIERCLEASPEERVASAAALRALLGR